MTWLEALRARFRALAVQGQLLAIVLTLVQAMLWIPMWAAMLMLIDDVVFAVSGRGIGWSHWVALWGTAALRVVIWVLRELLDLDLSENSRGDR